MTPRPKQHVKCHVDFNKGADHIIPKGGRKFIPCEPHVARSKIANAFPGESDLPEPWVHPRFSKAYHCGDTVLLVPPRTVCIPSSDTDIVTVCPAALNGEGNTTCWLKHKSPDARRAYAERKKAEADLDPLPEPEVRLLLGSTCVGLTRMFRVRIQSESDPLG